MAQLRLGVLSTSSKENELRLPIHPDHLERIDADLRERMVLERGYGQQFGVSDEHLATLVAGMGSRDEVIADRRRAAAQADACTTSRNSRRDRCSGGGHMRCRTPTSPRSPSTSA